MEETKTCEQCQRTKAFSGFHRRKNKTDGRMRICAACYTENLKVSRSQEEERQRRLQREQQRLREEEELRLEQERMARQQTLHDWYQLQPDRVCRACQKRLPASSFEYSEQELVNSILVPKLRQRCQDCHGSMREQQALPCCLCGKRTLHFNFLGYFLGFRLDGGGTRVYICCQSCESAFLALPENKQRFYIRSRCNIAFPDGQVIYGLFDPEPVALRYVGRTYHLQRRYSEHLRQRSSEAHTWGPELKPYYTRGNWIDDLHQRGLKPGKKELMTVEIAPMSVEWEKRHIWHAIQSGCKVVNHERMDEALVARIGATQLNFLLASFEELVAERFFSPTGIEAFVRAWYRP